MLKINEYALSFSWTQTRTEQGYESHYPSLDTCKFVNVLIQINESGMQFQLEVRQCLPSCILIVKFR